MYEHTVLTVAIFSLIITVATTLSAIYLIQYFVQVSPQNSTKMKTASPTSRRMPNSAAEITKTLKLSASATVICSAFSTIFNSCYCFYLIWDPMHDNDTFYIYHPSHIQRIASTCCWYIAKVALLWFFTRRLQYAFKGSILKVNKKAIIAANIINTIFVLIMLIIAYCAVYSHKLIIAELSFNIWRILYQIIALLVMYMFSKRLLQLTVQQRVEHSISGPVHREHAHKHTNRTETVDIENAQYTRSRFRSLSFTLRQQQNLKFMQIVTRNAVLVLTISVTVAMVTFFYFAFRFLFGKQTRMTLLIPMNMAAIDCLTTCICMLCMFPVGDRIYRVLCGRCCDSTCAEVCVYFAIRLQANPHHGAPIASSSISAIKREELQCKQIETITSLAVDDVNQRSLTSPSKPKLSLSKSNQTSNTEHAVILIDGETNNLEDVSASALTLNQCHSAPTRVAETNQREATNKVNKLHLNRASSLHK